MAELAFAGESFELRERLGLMPLMRYAHAAAQGLDTRDMEGMAAMYDMLKAVIAPSDWARFQQAAAESYADGDQLFDVINEAIRTISARPTSRPSDSSDGPPPESDSSADDSPSQVIARLEREGRPSLALMVQQAQRSKVSA